MRISQAEQNLTAMQAVLEKAKTKQLMSIASCYKALLRWAAPCLLMWMTACTSQPAPDSPEDYPALVGKTFPDFELRDLDGRTVRWSDLKGRPALVNFWFTRCPPCIAEMPHLNQLKRDFAEEGVAFLAISPDDSLTIRRFLDTHAYDFTILPGAEAYIRLFGSEYPLNVFVDKKGVIRHARGAIPTTFDQRHPQGFMDDREFRRFLGRLVRE